jgi:hypothetical protein
MRPRLEVLEDRLAPAIDLTVVAGGTLDVNPVSTIFPSSADTRMDVMTTSVPGLNHGTMYRVSFTDAYAWGSGPPNSFAPAASPSFNQNRIFAGEGFRYVNDGTGVGTSESIPVKFSDGTTDTLVIHINSADNAPTITAQPSPAITQVAPGDSVKLSVTASGPGPLSYQWYSGLSPNTSNPVSGATSSTFTTPSQTVGGQYQYWVQVSNASGVVNSLNAEVTVEEATTTTATSATVTYSRAAQQAPMQATVTRSSSGVFGIPDGGVTFTVPNVGSADSTDSTHNPSGIPANVALATLAIPGRTHAGVYSINASYLGNIPLYLAPSSDNSQTLTILKADQTISGFGALPAKTYGDATFTIGAGVSATSDPDAGGVTFTSLNTSVAVVNGTTVTIVGAGTAVIVASQAGNQDWNPAPDVEQTLTVNPAALKITAHDASRSYGAADPAFTVGYAGFVNGDGPAQLLNLPTVTTTATSASHVGTYALTAGGASAANYTITFVSGTLTVTPATLTVTADDKSRLYALPNPPLTASYSGFVNGEVLATSGVSGSPALTTAATAASPAGTYAIVSAAGTLAADNYSFRFVNGTLTVNKVTPTVTWADPAPIAYGTPLSDTQLNATADVAGTFSYQQPAGAVLDAGTQKLTVNFTPGDTTNYTSASSSVTLTVDKASPTFSALVSPGIVYGTATATLTGHLGAGGLLPPAGAAVDVTLDGVTQTATLDAGGDFSTTFDTATLGAGDHTIDYGYAGDGNFNSATGSGTLSVSRATPTITWATPAGITFGTALSAAQLNATVGVGGVGVAGTFAYSLADGTVVTAGTVLGAGTQTLSVTFTPADTADYNTPDSASVTFAVAKADPTVTWPTPGPITYGTPLSAINLNGTAVTLPGAGFETPHVNGVGSGFLYDPPLNPGQGQPWTFTGTVGDGSGVTGNLSAFTSLNPTAPEGEQVAFIQAAGSISQTLTLDAGSYTVSFFAAQRANQASTQEIQVLIDGKEVGRITPSGTDYGAYTTGVFTVAAGEHTLLFQGLNPQGGDNTAFIDQVVIAPGVYGTFAFTQPPDTVLNAGTHTLPVTFTPADTANYNSATAAVMLTVDKAAPTITWADPAAIVYGTALSDAQLNAKATGVAGVEVAGTFTYRLADDTALNVGTVLDAGSHTLSVTFTPTDTNYSSATADVTLTVDKATLTVTADDATRFYGVANPAFTASYSGFVNGDDLGAVSGSPILTTPAAAGSAPGTYAITVDVSALTAANYTLIPASGTLTVAPAPLSATGVNISIPVGAAFSGTVATFANADPFGSAASYAAAIAWGDGTTSDGTVTDAGGTFTVSGSHTYLSAGAEAIRVQISHREGYTTAATAAATAAVSGDAVFTGTGGESLVVTRTPSGATGDVTYTRDGGAPVALHGVTSLTFNGTGSDTLTVSLADGGPLVSGAVTAHGGTLALDAAGLPVQITPGLFSAGGQAVRFAGVAATLVNNAAASNMLPGPDTADRPTAFTGLTSQERFAQALYLDVLGRPGRRDELDYWVGVLNGPGGSVAAVAGGIERSFEARDRLVRSWYVTFLGRPASGGEELAWVNQLLQGRAEEAVLGDILGGPEFLGRAQTLVSGGAADERFVRALYQTLMGRAPADGEVAYWLDQLPQLGAAGVAQGFLRSAEYRTYLAESYYDVLLHRPSDAGRDFWVFSDLDATTMRVGFEATPEFFVNG